MLRANRRTLPAANAARRRLCPGDANPAPVAPRTLNLREPPF